MKTEVFNQAKLFLPSIVLVGLLGSTMGYTQSYVGHALDNYSGVHGILYNPANVVGTPMRTDINLFSVSAFAGSDYFGLSIGDLLKSDGGPDFGESGNRFPSDANHFFGNRS